MYTTPENDLASIWLDDQSRTNMLTLRMYVKIRMRLTAMQRLAMAQRAAMFRRSLMKVRTMMNGRRKTMYSRRSSPVATTTEGGSGETTPSSELLENNTTVSMDVFKLGPSITWKNTQMIGCLVCSKILIGCRVNWCCTLPVWCFLPGTRSTRYRSPAGSKPRRNSLSA